MTRDEIIVEMRFIEGDLNSFRQAMNAMSDRKTELAPYPDRQRSFLEWPATQAILNVLIMAISRCEGLLEDYKKLLEETKVPNNVVPLRLIGDRNDSVSK
jgi:hypothetical protein